MVATHAHARVGLTMTTLQEMIDDARALTEWSQSVKYERKYEDLVKDVCKQIR